MGAATDGGRGNSNSNGSGAGNAASDTTRTAHRDELLSARGLAARPAVLLIGDSITQQAEPALHHRLDERYDLTIWGIGGSRAEEHVHDDALVRAVMPDQVIINLGTNDVFQGTPPRRTIGALERIATGCGIARVVHLVTVSEGVFDHGSPVLRARSVELNRWIEALARARGWGLVPWQLVVDEYLRAGEPDGPFTDDTIHPAAAGRRLLATAYARALVLAERETSGPPWRAGTGEGALSSGAWS